MEQKQTVMVNVMLEKAKNETRTQPKVTDNWPFEFNVNDESEAKNLGLEFAPLSLSRMRQKEKKLKMEAPKDEIVFLDSPVNIAEDSNDSVYNSSNQSVDRKLESHLRASKLKKVITKDKHISVKRRQELKIRKNIIKFRMRTYNSKLADELTYKLIPRSQQKVRNTYHTG